MGQLIIEQDGADCIVILHGETRRIRDCNPLKLANTLWNKPGSQYTEQEMYEMGFGKKKEVV